VKWLEKRLVITVHGGGVPQRIKLYPGRYLPLLRSADLVTCPSEYIINELAQYRIFARLVENSIPLEQFSFIEKNVIRPVLLWMRGLGAIYNPAMAVHVVKELKKTYPAVKLYMGGNDMGLKLEIEELISSLALQDNIELVGFIDHKKKLEYAQRADIFISTNRVDNAPVSVTEMWALGLPVVSTNVGGMPFLIEDGKTGILVPDDDAIAMANSIKRLIQSENLANSISTNARKQVEKYSEEKVAAKWMAVLNRL
jgi:glycosyltransferase involved in cell wall biosynthesis